MSIARFLLTSGMLGLLAGPAAGGPALTVYSQDLGFVRESRALELAGARDTVRLPDVGERLDFSSVRLVPAGDARVARLAYRFDAASGDGVIERARGSRVRVLSRGDRLAEGTLVAADGSWLVLRADDGGVITLARGSIEEVRLSKAPDDMLLRPTLEAIIEGGRRGVIEAQLSYLTGGLSWSAEHSLVRRGESGGTWSASVTVENSSGREFRDATLKLVAGSPRRTGAAPPRPTMLRMATLGEAAGQEKTDLSEESFADYHLYSLDRTATLRDRESQTLSMIAPRPVKLTPRYLYRAGMSGVAAQVIVENTAAAGLGMPLPGGRVRVYEGDTSGTLQFTGEARIAHTAEGEKLTLEVGTAFDLAAERRHVSNRRISDREREYEIEIKLRNRKKGDVTILVEEPVSGENEVLKSSHPATRKDASTLQFTLPVPAGKEALLTFTLRVRY